MFVEGENQWLEKVKNEWNMIPDFRVDAKWLSHLALICDGNRRAASLREYNPWVGHRMGVEVIYGILEAGRKWGITNLTFWTWSTENWKRDAAQTKFVMELASTYLKDSRTLDNLIKHQVRFTHFGRKDRIPVGVKEAIEYLESETINFDKLYLNLALDYGGLDETARGIAQITEWILKGKLTQTELLTNPGIILGALDSHDQPNPDLVIRTGVSEGEIPHTSGFMPLQTTSSSWKFIPELFPDLTPNILLNQIKEHLNYNKRLGK
jgi:undecaprenyl diphosphate synthase